MDSQISFVGIDVSKDKFDIPIRPSDQSHSFVYDETGLQNLIVVLPSVEPRIESIVLEASVGMSHDAKLENGVVCVVALNDL